MQDRPGENPEPPVETPSATGSWRPAAPVDADPTPTVRRRGGPSPPSADSTPSRGAVGRFGPMEAGLPVPGDRLDAFEVARADRRRRHGGRLPGPRRAARPRRRAEGPAAGPGGRARERPPLLPGGPRRGPARPREHRPGLHDRPGPRAPLHRLRVHRGHDDPPRVEQHGPLSVAEAINYTLQIAGALVHASERGVVHRDIKPSNIIVTPQGRAKLVDMGLARRFEREGADDGLTQSNMTLGTFDYISPEQARDPRSVDVRSDLYSLGCTIYHMLTGQPPFPGGTVLQKLLSHREEPAPDVRGLNPDRAGRPGRGHPQADGQGPRPPLPVARAARPRPADDRRGARPAVDQPRGPRLDRTPHRRRRAGSGTCSGGCRPRSWR